MLPVAVDGCKFPSRILVVIVVVVVVVIVIVFAM
jgi:hypothetical protein